MKLIFNVNRKDLSKVELAKLIVHSSTSTYNLKIDFETSSITAEFSNPEVSDKIIDFVDKFFQINQIVIINETETNTATEATETATDTATEATETDTATNSTETATDTTIDTTTDIATDNSIHDVKVKTSYTQLIMNYILEKKIFSISELSKEFPNISYYQITNCIYRKKKNGIISSTGNRGEYKVNE